MSADESGFPVVTKEPRDLPAVREPGDMIAMIASAVSDQRLDVDKMRALFELQKDFMELQAKREFAEAMSRLQGKLPQIQKDGRIIVKNVERSRYARLEDIMRAIQPMLSEEGFSFSFDEELEREGMILFSAKLLHRGGHFEVKKMTLPTDKAAVGQYGPIRSAIQDAGSTATYAQRYLIKKHLNLIECGEDTDGAGMKPITEDQVRDLNTMLKDTGANRDGFLRFMGVEKLEDIREGELKKAFNALATKKQQQGAQR